jgi:hypothetical protein
MIDETLGKWLTGHDTGLSSKAIAYFMMGMRGVYFNYPHDPSDFGRCYRLMVLIPEFRKRLWEMKGLNRQWTALINHWEELEALWIEESNQERAPKLYARMRELIEGASQV